VTAKVFQSMIMTPQRQYVTDIDRRTTTSCRSTRSA